VQAEGDRYCFENRPRCSDVRNVDVEDDDDGDDDDSNDVIIIIIIVAAQDQAL